MNAIATIKPKIINGFRMSIRLIVCWLVCVFLMGCENTVDNNFGALPNINFSGSVWSGNVRNAQVQAVGIDSDGQPNRGTDGEYLGDSYFTDEVGVYNAQLQGAYLGSVLLVASFNKEEIEVRCLNEDDLGGCVDASGNPVQYDQLYTVAPTEIRCVVPDINGACIDEDGNAIAYGQWYPVTEDFELWAAINLASEGESYYITPFTHLASKLAFSEFVSDGNNCGSTFCNVTEYRTGLFTPQGIHEANTRVQELFGLSGEVHVSTIPWSPFSAESTSDAVMAIEEAKHGLLSLTLQQFAKQQYIIDPENTPQPLISTLDWWLDSFLSNMPSTTENLGGGQMIGKDSRTGLDKTFDLQTLYEFAVAAAGNFEDSSVGTAADYFSGILAPGLTSAVTQIQGDAYEVSVEDQIADARQLISDLQGWLVDFETNEYVSFLSDNDLADDLNRMEANIGYFKDTLGPELDNIFKPMVKFAEYGLTCARGTSTCDPGDVNDADNYFEYHTSVVYNAQDNTLEMNYQSATGPVLKMQMTGEIENVSTASEIVMQFTFTELVSVETDTGLAEISIVEEGVYPTFLLLLGSELVSGEAPDIQGIKLSYPRLKVKAKAAAVLNLPADEVIDSDNDGYMDLLYQSEGMALEMVGTQDATKPEAPTHFNIISVSIPGEVLSSESDNAESITLNISINVVTENMDTAALSTLSTAVASSYQYYAPEKFPDLDIVLDMAALKEFAKLQSGQSVSFGNSELAGWFAMPSDVVVDDKLVATVQYVEEPSYDNLDDDLKTLLALNSPFDFNYGALNYPGGTAAFVLYKEASASSTQFIRSCAQADGVWLCNTVQEVDGLASCALNDDGSASTTVYQAPSTVDMPALFAFLRDEDCIPQVRVQGRGVYDIQYPAVTDGETGFVANDTYDITLNTPYQLTIGNFSVQVVGNFLDENNLDENNAPESRPKLQLIIFGSAPDSENVALSFILTPGYIGEASGIPYGERSIWFAIGSSDESSSDSLIYYIQNGSSSLTMSAYQATIDTPDAPLGYLRYAGANIGTLSKEGNLYIVRYIDGSWQIL